LNLHINNVVADEDGEDIKQPTTERCIENPDTGDDSEVDARVSSRTTPLKIGAPKKSLAKKSSRMGSPGKKQTGKGKSVARRVNVSPTKDTPQTKEDMKEQVWN